MKILYAGRHATTVFYLSISNKGNRKVRINMSLKSSNKPDTTIIADVLNGNTNEYEKIITKYSNQIYKFIMKQVHNIQVAEDILQETFICSYKNLSKLKNTSKVINWLYGISQNIIRNYFNKELKYKSNLTTDAIINSIAEKKCVIEDFESKMFISEITNTVKSLPLEFREVIILISYEELHYNEVSKILNIPLGTVKSRLFAARKMLRKELLKKELI
jgi:RNA polymerase sigma-70 factor, ECF subfamily